MTFSKEKICNQKILVVGDVMLDRYWHGNTARISPEAPVPVVKIEECEARPGGAGNVALNIASLGASVRLFGLAGRDEAAKNLISELEKSNVDIGILCSDQLTTISKLRILSRHQQLIRLDQEENLDRVDVDEFKQLIIDSIAGASVVILSDYNKGTLNRICPDIIKACREKSVPVIIDPKGNHRERYQQASLLTPNMSEFEQMAGEVANDDDLINKARQLIREMQLDGLLLTRSEKGMTLVTTQDQLHIPSRVREVFDVTGAGDTVIAVFAAAIGSGMLYETAARLANKAAGIVVGKLGAASVVMDDLIDQSHRFSFEQKIQTEDALYKKLSTVRQSNTIVMTNGCFDLLQPGHIANLEQCRSKGDVLIVAVNDDKSVARLKGKDRPIVPLEARMQVLAGLGSVDYVVPFSEDSPERLISKLLPDVLAKGGDYKVEEIAGANAVIESGGQVAIIDLVDGYSSTNIIEKIKSLND